MYEYRELNYILNGKCGGQTLNWKAVLTWSPVSFQRRSYSLDVEVSASGFTKDMEQDGALLHPAGPEDNEEEDDDDDDNDYEDAKEATDEEREEAVDMEEYKHAMLELEGLRISETPAETQDQDGEKSKNNVQEDQETETASSPPGDEETEKQLDEELEEAEDEFPALADLSASNKEFKPFR